MTVKEREILTDTFDNIKRITGLKDISVKNSHSHNLDCEVKIRDHHFVGVIKPHVTPSSMFSTMQEIERIRHDTQKPVILVAESFSEDVIEKLASVGINAAERNGNCSINVPGLYIRIKGEKKLKTSEPVRNAFSEAGLKLIFYFLRDEENVRKPYRMISQDTGLSLGTISRIVDELINSRHILKTKRGRFIKDRRELLELWQENYNRVLKPKLLLKEMDFADDDTRRNWQQIVLPEGMEWGGESGAFILNGYLTPEKFEIYSDIPTNHLMKHRIKYRENGPIKVYRKFWPGEDPGGIVPMALLYADLMGAGMGRPAEAAQKLMEHEI